MYVSRRIWIGNTARILPLEERISPELTHEWKVYVRTEDTSLISSVIFKLHESFLNNVIETKNPFEITEQGWGEFTIQIKIITKYGTVNTTHFLKIHDTDVNERQDEIIFKGDQPVNYDVTEEEEDEYKKIERAIEIVLDKLEE